MAKRPAPRKPPAKPKSTKTPALEWAAAAIGLSLITFVLVLLVVQGAAPDGPPDLRLRQIEQRSTSDGHTVEVEIKNGGASAASAVITEGVLTPPGGLSETAEVTLDYIPARSTRRVSLVFEADPKTGRLDLRLKGYVEP